MTVYPMQSSNPAYPPPPVSLEPGEPPFNNTKKKLVIVLSNASEMGTQKKMPIGFDVRDLAHICEILYAYVSYGGRVPAVEGQGQSCGTGSECTYSNPAEPHMYTGRFFEENFILASIQGGPCPIEPFSLKEGRQDIVTREFLNCQLMMNMIKNTKVWASIDPNDTFGVLFLGGHGPFDNLANYKEGGVWLSHAYHSSHATIGAICHGPAALMTMPGNQKGEHFLKGKKVTCFSNDEERQLKTDESVPYSLENKMRELGADLQQSDSFNMNVVQDGRLLTAQNAESVRKLMRRFIITSEKSLRSKAN